MSENPRLVQLVPQPFLPQRILLFRIVPVEILEEVFEKGKICPPCLQDISAYKAAQLAKPNMIDRRQRRQVPEEPFGNLHEYLAFYFAPRSPMLYSIHMRNAESVTYSQENVVYLVTRIGNVEALGLPYVYTDRNALLQYAAFHTELSRIQEVVDFPLMEAKFWKDQPEDRQRRERRMAEFLVKACLPVNAIVGIAVFDENKKERVEKLFKADMEIPVKVMRDWYY